MNLFKTTFRRKAVVAAFLSLFIINNVLADGTRQVSPTNSVNGTALLSAPDVNIGPFRNASDEKRLRFTIVNNATENLYFGFQPRTYENSLTTLKNNVYFRIFNAAGTQVQGPTLIPVAAGTGFIANYTQAFAGPNIGGATPTGYTPFLFDPTANGDFYIELYSSNNGGVTADVTSAGRVTFPFFDLTVSTTSSVQSIGRLWSKEWGLAACNLTSGNFQNDWNSSFTGKFIAYSPDQFKLQVNFTSGFRPLGFEVAMNYEGVGNSGVWTNDRKSVNANVTVPDIVNGYKVFLTEPDIVAFPNGTIANPAITKKIFGCQGGYYIPYYLDQPGDFALLLDLNGTAGFQPGTSDIVLEAFNQSIGSNVFFWNGLDGLGNPVPSNFVAQVTTYSFQGRTNIPMFDAELNIGGISVTSVYPNPNSNRQIFWDDSSITPFGTCLTQEENETTGGIVRSGLFGGVFGPTHAWNGSNPNLTVPASAGGQGSATNGALCDDYGNNRVINSWFYASDIASNTLSLKLPSCDNDDDGISDNLDIDDDNDGIYDVVEYVGLPNPWADADLDGIPNFLDPSATGFVDTNFDGVDDRYDFDLDGVINQFDQDTDNDGIPDNIEAQTTLGYVAPTGTINAQGVYPSYFALGGLVPVNTDGTDNPDYKDLNSDNEGGNDTAEAGITLIGLDTDGDGLDNATDATPTTGYADVNGIYDNTQFDNFPDVDADVLAGGDVDWRDAIFNDHDNDGVPDLVDLDDDNDGILDTVENGGLADPLADADGDGILNYLDPTFPGRIDANGDGVDDRYDFDLDGIINEFDLDSDNDGIFDVIEAGGVDSDLNGTANDDDNNVNNTATNGIPTSAGAGTTPLDFGNNGTPNYLNLDSDEDGCFDVREAGFVDQNNDGKLGTNPTIVNADGRVTGTTATNGYTGTNANVTTAGIAGSITTQPAPTTNIATGSSGNISVVAAGSGLVYQWQISTNGGTSWTNVSNGGASPVFAGATTASLSLSNVPATSNGHRFRVLITSPTYVCTNLTSGSSILNVAASADLSITKTITSSPVVIGGTVTYNITVTNNGPSTSTGFSVVDNLPAGLTYNSHTAPVNGTFNSGTMTWTSTSTVLTSGQSSSLTIVCNVLANGGPYTNQAVVTGNISDPSLGNNTVNTPLVPTSSADVSVVKTASNMAPQVGTNVTFTIVASNVGPSPATAVNITDNLPAGYSFAPATVPPGTSYSAGVWTIPTLGVGAGNNLTMTIVGTVLPNQAPSAYANTASITSSSTPDPNSGNNTSTVTPVPVAVADLQMTKTISPANPAVGSTVTFTLKVKNNGLSNATGVQVVDNIAAASGFSFGTLTPPVGTTWNSGTNTWAIGNLNSGDSILWSFTATVNASGNYTNTATVSGSQLDNNPANNTSSASAGAVPQADLEITKTANTATPLVGGQITFTLTAKNNGPSTAASVNVFDNLPAGYSNPVSVPAGAFVGNTWAVGNLASGASTSITVTATVLATGPYNNTATISSSVTSDPNSTNNSSTFNVTPIPVSDLSVVKTVSSASPAVGSNVTFTITVTNNGPSPATIVQVIDTLRSGYTYVGFTAPAGQIYNITGPNIWKFTGTPVTIASGSSAVYTIIANVKPSGIYTNCANVSATELDQNLANNRSCAAAITPVPQTDRSIVKTASNLTPNVGSNVTFTLTASNAGPSNATGVVVTDVIPSGYTFIGTIPAGIGSYNSGNNTYTWSIGTMNSGAAAQSVQLLVSVNSSGAYQNCAQISGIQSDPNASNDLSCATPVPVPQANISIVKEAVPTTGNVGSPVSFVITVTNNGPSAASNVVVKDSLPAGYTFVSAVPATYNQTTHEWPVIANLANGSVINYIINAVIAPNGTPTTYTNTATALSPTVDPVLTNNSDTARVNVTQVANLAIAKSYSPANPTVGSQIVFTITASNLGLSNATGVIVNDPLPAGYSLDSITTSQGIYTSPNWNVGNILAGSSASMQVYAIVQPTGSLTNTAIISGDQPDPNSSNNTVTVTPSLTNVPPVANNDTTTTLEDNAVSINVVNPIPSSASTDTDIDGTVNPSTVDLQPGGAINNNGVSAGGNWTVTPGGLVTYTPNANFNGLDSISYTVNDDDGAVSNIAWVFVNVIPVNDAPIANNDPYIINEDSTLVVNITTNDDDIDGTINTATVDLNPSLPGIQNTIITSAGTWTVNPLGVLTFVPVPDTCGFTATLPYTVNDNLGLTSNIANVLVTIICVNDPPVAINDCDTTFEDTPITFNILANDYDIDSPIAPQTADLDTLTVGVQDTIYNVFGTWILDAFGNLTYSPAPNFTGVATIYYTVCDTNLALSNVASIKVVVLPVDDAPVAVNDTTSTNEDTAVTFNITTNDYDVDGNLNISTVVLDTTSNPTYGTWSVNNLGNVTYTPAPNFNGTATITYTILDSTGLISNVAAIVVIVNPINDTPIVDADYAFTSINLCVSGDMLTIGDYDPDTTLLYVTTYSSPLLSGSTITIDSTGLFTYCPGLNVTGFDTVYVTVCDSGNPLPAICVIDTLIIEISANTPPIANNDTASVFEDTPGGVTFNVTNNDIDPNGGAINPASVDFDIIQGNPNILVNQYGTWTTGPLGTVTYIPAPNFCGTAYAQYWIYDNNNQISLLPALITVNVICLNDAPITSDVTVSTPINTPIGVNVSAGTSDLENNPITYSYILTGPGIPAGTDITIDGNGAITVTPPTNFIGVITFPFTACDLSPYNVTILCDSGVITVNVVDTNGINNPPLANDDLVSTLENTPVIVNPLGNDTDPDGDLLTVTILNGPSTPGSSAGPVNANGTIPYTPAPGFTGVDSIQYQICDDNVSPLCDLAWIYITVSPGFDSPNAPPIATNDYTAIDEESVATYNVLTNDTDPNGDNIILSSTIVSGPNNGSATINPLTGEITYTPNPNFYGQDTVQYQICDDGIPSLCDSGLFVITVLPINDGPTTTNITVYTSVNTAIGVNVGAGTSDPENNPLTYSYDFTQLPSTVVTTITGNGAIVVTPGPVGTYTIPFQVCDLSAYAPITLCDSGYITVIVVDTTAPNFPPVANNDLVNTPMDSSIVINPLANDFDPDLDPLTVTILSGPSAPGAIAGPVGSNGTIPYTPGTGFTGLDSIQYQACDPAGLCDTAWIYITISPVVDTPNVAPIATDDFASTDEDVDVTIFVLNNDSDPNGNGLNNPTVILVPSNGTATPNSTGQIVYSPNPNFYGVDTFVYLVCDNGNPSLCDTAVVIVTVNPANDGPTANDIIVNMNENSSLGVNVGAAVSDPENNPLYYTYGSSTPAGVTYVITGNGVITVTSGTAGTYIIPYTVCDSSNSAPISLCDNGTITVIVIDTTGGLNNPPVANNDQVTTTLNTSVIVNPIANDFDVDGDTLDITLIPNTPVVVTSNGTASILNGLVTYTPNPTFQGVDSIPYSICDPAGLCDTAWIYVTVSPVVDTPNVAPIATDDYATTDVFTPVTVAVLNNDSDPNGNGLNVPVVILTGPSVPGSIAIPNSNGTITFIPDTTFIGTDSVQYLVCDNGNPSLCDTAWLFITVSPINNAPVANDIIVNMNENSSLGVNVGAAVSDSENNPLYYTYGSSTPAGVTYVITGNGVITVTSGTAGTYVIPYTVCDSSSYSPFSLCDNGTITIIVIDTTGGLNNPPVANNDQVTTTFNTPVIVNPIANDFDVDGDTLDITLIPNIPVVTSNGTASILNGLVTYTPNPTFLGIDSIPYSICDPAGLCDTAWIYVTVSPVVDTPNVAPIATDDYAITDIVTPVTFAVLNNDSDPNGNGLNVPVVILTGPSTTGSIASANPNGTITFTPGPLFISGTDSVEYLVCDNGTPSLCDTAWLFVTISPSNQGPTTNDVWVITSTDIPIGVNVSAGTSDPENNPLTYTYDTSSLPVGTVVVINGNGTITVTPPPGFTNDTIIIPFTVCDSSAYAPVSICANGNIYVVVVDTTNGNNEAPIANDDLVTTPMNTAVTVNPLGNDTDANGGPLTVTLLPGVYPVNGGLTPPVLLSSGAVIYTPNPGFFGIDSIPYQVCDPLGLCDQAWIIITVSPVVDTPNVAPIATNDYAFIPEDSTVTVAVLNNDSDPNGNNIGAPVIIGGPSFGVANVNPGDSTITYTPWPNWYGTDTITYQICDDGNPVMCDVGQLIIVVSPINDGPITNDITVITQVDTPIGVNVGAGSSDPENNPLTFTYGTPNIGGVPLAGVTIDSTGTGTINVTPPAGFVGTFTIPFQVCDSSQFLPYVLCDSGYITVIVVDTVGAPNNAPIANNDLVSTPINTAVIVNPLGNDFDVNGDPLTVTLIPSSPFTTNNNGIATVDPLTGLVTYVPFTGFIGVDSIPYSICDNGTPNLCDTAWIIITISPVVDTSNVPPLATDDFATTPDGTPIIIAVLNNDSDPNGNAIGNPSIVILPTNGSALPNSNGTITYTPIPGFIGIDSFTYVICDNGNPVMCDTAVVYINVYSPNDAPSQGNETISVVKWCDTPYANVIDVLANNIDPNGDPLTVTPTSGTTTMGGTFTVNANNEIIYVSAQNYTGMDTLIYTVCDDYIPAACVTDTIFITVLPDNDCDSIPDNIDIDDDNDGIRDLVECLTANNSCDTDLDGIPDYFDLDSDNDGIPDIVEAGGAQYDLNFDGVIDDTIDTDNDGLFDIADGDNGGTYLPVPDTDNDSHPDFQDLDSDNDGISDLLESGGLDVNHDGLIDNFNDADDNGIDDNDAIYTPLDTDGDLIYDFLDLDADNDGISDILESGQPDTDGDGMIDSPANNDANLDGLADSQVGVFPQDTDNDGLTNNIDLDADDDGIPDVVENGYGDANQDGLVDAFTDANNNGWNDSSEGTTLLNSDSDLLPDYLDLDSDQDGIPDVVEGGQNDLDMDGLVDNYNDINGNGWSDNTEGDVISDVDTDGIPDYLDSDSDGDGCLDVAEGGFFDTNFDGVIDNFTDSNNDGWDNLGFGWTIPDTDGDSIFNFRDLDSDNDGLLDEVECGLDCDNDGIPDNIDTDLCDDEVLIPNGFTPNGDGYNDFFVIEGIERFPNNSIQFFNRWGNLVYSTDDYQNDWAGKSTSQYNVGGEDLPTGTYYYMFDTGSEAYGVLAGYIYIQR